jgi:hypothetical protein
MNPEKFEKLVETIWHRLEEKLETLLCQPPTVERLYCKNITREEALPDAKIRLAALKQATRNLELAEGVDLRDVAITYPLTKREILGAVKLMAGSGIVRGEKEAKVREYTLEDLTDAIFKILAFNVLACRSEGGDDKPKEAPCTKAHRQSGSFCHEDLKEKGDFSCRGTGDTPKEFTCQDEDAFICQPFGKDKFICDADPNRTDKFTCSVSGFLCNNSIENPFYCLREADKFECSERDEKSFYCSSIFNCPSKDRGGGFYDSCFPLRTFIF